MWSVGWYVYEMVRSHHEGRWVCGIRWGRESGGNEKMRFFDVALCFTFVDEDNGMTAEPRDDVSSRIAGKKNLKKEENGEGDKLSPDEAPPNRRKAN